MAVRVGGRACEVDAAGVKLDEEQHIVAPQQRGIDADEVTRDDARGRGFWWQGTFAAYQSGWDPRLARHSMGSVLVLHALERAADDGAHAFDFLRGSEPYKYRFGACDRCDRTWLVPRGPAGALLASRHRLRLRLHRVRTA